MEVKWIAVPGALAQIVVATLLGWALAWSMGWSLIHGLVFGLALSVASTVVLLRALEERRLLDTQRGRIAVGWLIVEDLVMVLALVLLPALADVLGTGAPAAAHDAQSPSLLAALGVTLLKMVAFVAAMLVIGRRVIPWSLEKWRQPARANCSPWPCSASRWAWHSCRPRCLACRSRSARSSPACCSRNRNSAIRPPTIRCHCAMHLRCCSSYRWACCSTR